MSRRREKRPGRDATSPPARFPHPYLREIPLPSHLVDEYASRLTVGSLWRTRVGLCRLDRWVHGFEAHDFMYVVGDHMAWVGSDVGIPRDSVALYAGQHCVTESDNGSSVTVPRHTFVIGGARYLVLSLIDFEYVPAGEKETT